MISMWIDDPQSFSFAPLPCLAMDYHPGMMDNDINCLRTNLWGDWKNESGRGRALWHFQTTSFYTI